MEEYLMSKPWWLSRTIWVNLFALLGAVAIGQYVDSATWAEISAAAIAVVNVVLRCYTGSPLEGTPGENQ
jgi:hypothetical protein